MDSEIYILPLKDIGKEGDQKEIPAAGVNAEITDEEKKEVVETTSHELKSDKVKTENIKSG